MENISKYISELLFDHDCVIVPQLGGFLASNEFSKIVQPNQVIYPPFRHIAFNIYLKQNDGLLANHIVESEKITYKDAIRHIDTFTTFCFENLDNGKKVSIDEVGSLYYDKERNIQFEAYRNFNHLKDSFGMEPIHFLPIQRDEVAEKKKQVHKIRPSIKKERKENPINNKSKRYIGIAIAASAIVLFSINLYFMAPKNYEATSLNPFDTQETIISQIDSIRNMPAPVIIPNDSESEIINNDTQTVTASIEEPEKEVVVNTPPENIPPTVKSKPVEIISPPVTVKNTTSTGTHYVIAGVFKIRDNAESLVVQLRQRGFSDATIVEANRMNYVSYGRYTSWTQASSAVDSIKRQNLDGWVWRH